MAVRAPWPRGPVYPPGRLPVRPSSVSPRLLRCGRCRSRYGRLWLFGRLGHEGRSIRPVAFRCGLRPFPSLAAVRALPEPLRPAVAVRAPWPRGPVYPPGRLPMRPCPFPLACCGAGAAGAVTAGCPCSGALATRTGLSARSPSGAALVRFPCLLLCGRCRSRYGRLWLFGRLGHEGRSIRPVAFRCGLVRFRRLLRCGRCRSRYGRLWLFGRLGHEGLGLSTTGLSVLAVFRCGLVRFPCLLLCGRCRSRYGRLPLLGRLGHEGRSCPPGRLPVRPRPFPSLAAVRALPEPLRPAVAVRAPWPRGPVYPPGRLPMRPCPFPLPAAVRALPEPLRPAAPARVPWPRGPACPPGRLPMRPCPFPLPAAVRAPSGRSHPAPVSQEPWPRGPVYPPGRLPVRPCPFPLPAAVRALPEPLRPAAPARAPWPRGPVCPSGRLPVRPCPFPLPAAVRALPEPLRPAVAVRSPWPRGPVYPPGRLPARPCPCPLPAAVQAPSGRPLRPAAPVSGALATRAGLSARSSSGAASVRFRLLAAVRALPEPLRGRLPLIGRLGHDDRFVGSRPSSGAALSVSPACCGAGAVGEAVTAGCPCLGRLGHEGRLCRHSVVFRCGLVRFPCLPLCGRCRSRYGRLPVSREPWPRGPACPPGRLPVRPCPFPLACCGAGAAGAVTAGCGCSGALATTTGLSAWPSSGAALSVSATCCGAGAVGAVTAGCP